MMLDDIAGYLQNVATPIYKGTMPDTPDDCIGLFEYAGEPISLDWRGESPNLQVMVRNKSYEQGRLTIANIQRALHGVNNKDINGTRYLLIRALQSPEHLGRDENNRCEFVQNFQIIKEVKLS